MVVGGISDGEWFEGDKERMETAAGETYLFQRFLWSAEEMLVPVGVWVQAGLLPELASYTIERRLTDDMARHMSFMLTTRQVIEETKTVTRRLRWLHAKPGMELIAVEKGQGLGPGGKVNRLKRIRIKDVRKEPLSAMLEEPYGSEEAEKEGYPGMTGAEFVAMFCEHMHVAEETRQVTRIEFEYIENGDLEEKE